MDVAAANRANTLDVRMELSAELSADDIAIYSLGRNVLKNLKTTLPVNAFFS